MSLIAELKEEIDLIKELFPICRSITGNGVRKTLSILSKYVPMEIHEIPTGTKVFDWVVPDEWNINKAFIECPDGSKIADFSKNNLHVMSYSEPINEVMSLEMLKDHIHTLPEHPEWIPYRTMYYDRSWSFCLSQNTLDSLSEGSYRAYIDSEFSEGSLTYGEVLIPGTSDKEIVFSCYVCHPSMCNDNLSGVAVATKLAQSLSKIESPYYNYRILFIPETIGAITWLSENENRLDKIVGGVVLTCIGNNDKLTFKRSRWDTSLADKAMKNCLNSMQVDYRDLKFSPSGSDERQYCSPGINLPFLTLMRSAPSKFNEYHTSADNIEFMHQPSLKESHDVCLKFVNFIEKNRKYKNLYPKCEPQLGKRGIYRKVGGQKVNSNTQTAMKWILNYSDGNHDIFQISDLSGMSIEDLCNAADILEEKCVIQREY